MGTVGNMPRGQRRFQPITFRVEMLKRLMLVAIHSTFERLSVWTIFGYFTSQGKAILNDAACSVCVMVGCPSVCLSVPLMDSSGNVHLVC